MRYKKALRIFSESFCYNHCFLSACQCCRRLRSYRRYFCRAYHRLHLSAFQLYSYSTQQKQACTRVNRTFFTRYKCSCNVFFVESLDVILSSHSTKIILSYYSVDCVHHKPAYCGILSSLQTCVFGLVSLQDCKVANI